MRRSGLMDLTATLCKTTLGFFSKENSDRPSQRYSFMASHYNIAEKGMVLRALDLGLVSTKYFGE